jgi:hypothetical protein
MNFKLNAFDTTVYETKEFVLKICDFFAASLYTRERLNKKTKKVYKSYNVMSIINALSKRFMIILVNILLKCKYLNFMDWASIVEMPKPLSKERKVYGNSKKLQQYTPYLFLATLE